MNVLFLDDCPNRTAWARGHLAEPGGAFAAAANAYEAVTHLTLAGADRPWGVVYLDHDLEGVGQDPGHPNSGSAVVRWVVANRPAVGRFVVHTTGDQGRVMARDLALAGYRAEYVSFLDLLRRYDPDPAAGLF